VAGTVHDDVVGLFFQLLSFSVKVMKLQAGKQPCAFL
jgi:hypothetical protein